MDFDLSDVALAWRDRAAALGREVAADAAAATVIQGAARAGLLDPAVDLLTLVVACEALGEESPAAAVTFALHSAVAVSLLSGGAGGTLLGGAAAPFDEQPRPTYDEKVRRPGLRTDDAAAPAVRRPGLRTDDAAAPAVRRPGLRTDDAAAPAGEQLFRGEVVAAVGLSSDEMPVEQNGRLSGRAPWVAPITTRGIAVVGPQRTTERVAYLVNLDAPGVTVAPVETAALAGLVCGHVSFNGAACEPIGATLPIMIRIRILMAAAGLGIGRRALREALATAKAARTAAAGEQTVQGLLADAATDLDAAQLMTWKAAHAAPPSLADASLAKLMTTAAAQRAVERATQVVGADSFQRGHIIERLAQDVRALELFAGRTEALRAAAAEAILPRVS